MAVSGVGTDGREAGVRIRVCCKSTDCSVVIKRKLSGAW